MRIIATFLILASAFTVLVAVRSYNAHIQQEQEEQEEKSLREKIIERECKLMFPMKEEYYQQCLHGKRRDV